MRRPFNNLLVVVCRYVRLLWQDQTQLRVQLWHRELSMVLHNLTESFLQFFVHFSPLMHQAVPRLMPKAAATGIFWLLSWASYYCHYTCWFYACYTSCEWNSFYLCRPRPKYTHWKRTIKDLGFKIWRPRLFHQLLEHDIDRRLKFYEHFDQTFENNL